MKLFITVHLPFLLQSVPNSLNYFISLTWFFFAERNYQLNLHLRFAVHITIISVLCVNSNQS